MPGRPTKLTPALQDEIVAYVEEGAPLETCAQACGIVRATLYNWLDWGIAGRAPYDAFLDAVARARARAEIKLLRRVRGEEEDPDTSRIDEDDVQEMLRRWHSERARGAAWTLERIRPDQYAQRVNLRVNQAVSEVLEVVRGLCAPEDFERICERLAGGNREGGDDAPAALASDTQLDS